MRGMWVTRRQLTIGALLVAGVSAQDAALAHGPCGCVDPRIAASGQTVRIDSPAYRVIFNPRPTDLGIAPGYLAGAFRADAPSVTVLSRPKRNPTRKGRFRVPAATPPGLYMVLVFDGEEGGAHNTWDYVHVADYENSTPGGVVARSTEVKDRGPGVAVVENTKRSDRSDETSPGWLVFGLVVLATVGVGFLSGRRVGRAMR